MVEKNKTEFVEFNGKIKFIHAKEYNKYGKWSVTFYPDEPSLERLRELQSEGLKNRMKKDDDGYYMNINRDPVKNIRGVDKHFEPPKVTDINGKAIDGSTIGWGSDGIITLEVYTHKTPSGGSAVAARWDGIKITNLVPYEKREETKEDDPW